MNEQNSGIYLYTKVAHNDKVLKELLQFIKSTGPLKNLSFSYVDSDGSLHPDLSLWENIQLESQMSHWSELEKNLLEEYPGLTKLLKNPYKTCRDSAPWESFMASFIKGILSESSFLLIDMNENLFPDFLTRYLKKMIIKASTCKNICLASSDTFFWLDCSHTLVGRKNYAFQLIQVDTTPLKKKQAC